MNRKILRLAIPNIISNITVPLLGLIDIGIVGHLSDQSYIGAIAIGGMIFNLLYWNFGFLRMGTSGLTAQAYGKRDFKEIVSILLRSLGVGTVFALLLLLLQTPLINLIFRFLDAGIDVKRHATVYYHIVIWGAPALLGLYSLKGWFIGMQNSHFPMWISISINCINIIASLIFVYLLNWGINGVALGTMLAQWSGFILALLLWRLYYNRFTRYIRFKESFKLAEMKAFFNINRDIFLRTLCLIVVMTFFTSTGAVHGDRILAVNTLLMQFFTLFSYIMDGFAYAGESLTGRYIGAGNSTALHKSIRTLFYWGTGIALLFSLLYGFFGRYFLKLLTDHQTIIELADNYFYWILAIPICGFSAFLWDGIFIGATAGREMRNTMFGACGIFFGIYYLLRQQYDNHALWLAFLCYLFVRGTMQWYLADKAVYSSKKLLQ